MSQLHSRLLLIKETALGTKLVNNEKNIPDVFPQDSIQAEATTHSMAMCCLPKDHLGIFVTTAVSTNVNLTTAQGKFKNTT